MKESTSKDNLHIIQLCERGLKMEAVKFYQIQYDASLKDANTYVNSLILKHGVKTKSGCFIATACYGDYDAPEVKILPVPR